MTSDDHKPSLSIIVPIYNAEKFMDRCMKSIYEQTLTNYEIILVNDGSKDRSAEMCQSYAKKDKRVTFINKEENCGAGAARNAGIEIAKGEYLAFPDVDDWFEPTMYADLYMAAKANDDDIVFSGVNFYSHSAGGELRLSRSVECAEVTFRTAEECRANIMLFFPTTTLFDSPCNKLYKRSVAMQHHVRFSDIRRCQDAMFNLDFYDAIGSLSATKKAYYNYIQNTEDDVNRKFPLNYIEINIAYYSKLIATFSTWGMYSDHIKQHYDTSFVLAVYGTIMMYDNPRWKLSKTEQKEYVIHILERRDIRILLNDVDVRDDSKSIYRLLTSGDVKKIMRIHKRDHRKDVLRRCRILVRMYRKLKGT